MHPTMLLSRIHSRYSIRKITEALLIVIQSCAIYLLDVLHGYVQITICSLRILVRLPDRVILAAARAKASLGVLQLLAC